MHTTHRKRIIAGVEKKSNEPQKARSEWARKREWNWKHKLCTRFFYDRIFRPTFLPPIDDGMMEGAASYAWLFFPFLSNHQPPGNPSHRLLSFHLARAFTFMLRSLTIHSVSLFAFQPSCFAKCAPWKRVQTRRHVHAPAWPRTLGVGLDVGLSRLVMLLNSTRVQNIDDRSIVKQTFVLQCVLGIYQQKL